MMQKRWDGFVPASCAKDKNGADFDREMEQVGWRDDGGSARTGHERRGSEVTEAGKKLLDAMVSWQEGRAVAKRMDDWQESRRLLWMTSNRKSSERNKGTDDQRFLLFLFAAFYLFSLFLVFFLLQVLYEVALTLIKKSFCRNLKLQFFSVFLLVI